MGGLVSLWRTHELFMKEAALLQRHPMYSGQTTEEVAYSTAEASNLQTAVTAQGQRRTLRQLLIGEATDTDIRNLWLEVKASLTLKLVIASICSFIVLWCQMLKARAIGHLTDSLTRPSPPPPAAAAPPSFSASASFSIITPSWQQQLQGALGIAPSSPLGELLQKALQTAWLWQIGLILLLSLGEWLATFLRDWLLEVCRAERRLVSRGAYFSAMLQQEPSFHDSSRTADLAQRLLDDPALLEDVALLSLERLLRGLSSLAALGYLLFVDWPTIALGILLRLPFMLQLVERSVQLVAGYDILQRHSLMQAHLRATESLTGIRSVQAFTAEQQELRGYLSLLSSYARIAKSSAAASALLKHFEKLLLLANEVIMLCVGGFRIWQGSITWGELSSYRYLVDVFSTEFHHLEALYISVRRNAVQARRFFVLRDRQPSIPSSAVPAAVLERELRRALAASDEPVGEEGKQEADSGDSDSAAGGKGGSRLGKKQEDGLATLVETTGRAQMHGSSVSRSGEIELSGSGPHRRGAAISAASSAASEGTLQQQREAAVDLAMELLCVPPGAVEIEFQNVCFSYNSEAGRGKRQGKEEKAASEEASSSSSTTTTSRKRRGSTDSLRRQPSATTISFDGDMQEGQKPLLEDQSKAAAAAAAATGTSEELVQQASASSSSSLSSSTGKQRHSTLQNVSFRILPGERCVLVGPSGAGKTSIVKLLLRCYDPDSGRILVNGRDLQEWDVQELRSKIALVEQTADLFDRPLQDNILFGWQGKKWDQGNASLIAQGLAASGSSSALARPRSVAAPSSAPALPSSRAFPLTASSSSAAPISILPLHPSCIARAAARMARAEAFIDALAQRPVDASSSIMQLQLGTGGKGTLIPCASEDWGWQDGEGEEESDRGSRMRAGSSSLSPSSGSRSSRSKHCGGEGCGCCHSLCSSPGFLSLAGERGNKLSGGMRQRVSIARAIARNAELLLLDEYVNNLDSSLEHEITEQLEELCRGRTSITVAHRLGTAQTADRVLVLDHGMLVEQGTHQQLLKEKPDGLYAALVRSQQLLM